MKRSTISLPDDLEAKVVEFLAQQEPEPSLTSLVQAALRRYLDEMEWSRRRFTLPTQPLEVTPAVPGSGHADSSEQHDRALTERL